MTGLFAMGRSGNSRWDEFILRELESPEPRLRLEAIAAASEAELAAATPSLRNLASHPDKDIRMAAVWALANTRGPGALETLEMCALSEDPEVRAAAEDALDEFDAMAQMEMGDDAFDDENSEDAED